VYRINKYQVALQGQVVETGVAFVITLDYNEFKELFEKVRKNKTKIKNIQNSLMNKNSILYLLLYYCLWRAAAVQEIYRGILYVGAKIKWKAMKRQKERKALAEFSDCKTKTQWSFWALDPNYLFISFWYPKAKKDFAIG
jgi:hypothetical protein